MELHILYCFIAEIALDLNRVYQRDIVAWTVDNGEYLKLTTENISS